MMTTSDVQELGHPTDAAAPAVKVGSYLLGREIGRGATGVLYEARHVNQERGVILKLLDPTLLGVKKASRQDALFAREAMTLAEIPRHPGIVGILDAGLADGLPFIVTEQVEGQPLAQSLKVRNQDLKALVRILRDTALAVHHSHEHKVLHRNLKPSNVIVDLSGHPHVTDFGSAKRVDPGKHQSTTFTLGGSVGTPAYMSPERASGLSSVDRRTDVYSLGAMLYEAITGRPPFLVSGTIADLVTLVRGDIDLPSRVRPVGGAPGGDPVLDAICMKALAKQPDGRYSTAKEFADALSGWLGESAVMKEASIPSRAFIGVVCLLIGLAAAAALAYVGLCG